MKIKTLQQISTKIIFEIIPLDGGSFSNRQNNSVVWKLSFLLFVFKLKMDVWLQKLSFLIDLKLHLGFFFSPHVKKTDTLTHMLKV